MASLGQYRGMVDPPLSGSRHDHLMQQQESHPRQSVLLPTSPTTTTSKGKGRTIGSISSPTSIAAVVTGTPLVGAADEGSVVITGTAVDINDSSTTHTPPEGGGGAAELECDYDSSPSVLYRNLKNGDWDLAQMRSRSHPEETRTWIARRDATTKQIRWRLLPLHAAIIFGASGDVVQTLLNHYPAGAEAQDDQGMLPLHLAFRGSSPKEDIIEKLLNVYPSGIHVQDKRGRIPLAHAQKPGLSQTSNPGTTSKVMKIYAHAAVLAEQMRTTTTTTTTITGEDMSLVSSPSPVPPSSISSHHRPSTTGNSAPQFTNTTTAASPIPKSTAPGSVKARSAAARASAAIQQLKQKQQQHKQQLQERHRAMSSASSVASTAAKSIPFSETKNNSNNNKNNNNNINNNKVEARQDVIDISRREDAKYPTSLSFPTKPSSSSPPYVASSDTYSGKNDRDEIIGARTTEKEIITHHYDKEDDEHQEDDNDDDTYNDDDVDVNDDDDEEEDDDRMDDVRPARVRSPVSNPTPIRPPPIEPRSPTNTVLSGNTMSSDVSELRIQAEAHERQLSRQARRHEEDMRSLRTDLEDQMSDLKGRHKIQMDRLRKNHTSANENLQKEHAEAIRTMRERHDQHMDDLRQSLEGEVTGKREVNTMLREEVDDLKQRLSETQKQCEMFRALLNATRMQQSQLAEEVAIVVAEQEDVVNLVLRQREEMETAHAVRDKLIQALCAQEDEDRVEQMRGADELVDIVSATQDRLDAVLARLPEGAAAAEGAGVGAGAVPSLIEEEEGSSTSDMGDDPLEDGAEPPRDNNIMKGDKRGQRADNNAWRGRNKHDGTSNKFTTTTGATTTTPNHKRGGGTGIPKKKLGRRTVPTTATTTLEISHRANDGFEGIEASYTPIVAGVGLYQGTTTTTTGRSNNNHNHNVNNTGRGHPDDMSALTDCS